MGTTVVPHDTATILLVVARSHSQCTVTPPTQILLEREWLSFGHKFTDRLGLLSTTDPRDVSPVFSQFLDCTWQLKQQFPTAFQFNEHFLITLHHQVYVCQVRVM